MNIKTIIVGSLALGCVVGGTFFKMNSEDVQSNYTPRTLTNGGVKGNAGYAEYINMLKADPATGKVDPNLVAQARTAVAAKSQLSSKTSLGLNWSQMGPDNVGGRTRAVLVDNNDINKVYAGSISGGLFESNDGALTWNPVPGMQGLSGENLIISCITQTASGRIFFGTGSTFEGATGPFIGNGIYEYVPSTGQVHPVITNTGTIPNNNVFSTWSYTNAITAKGERLYVGTASGMFWADPTSGDYPTDLSGWTNPIEVLPNSGILETSTCHDIDISSDGSMIVCFGSKIYTSLDDSFGSFTKTVKSASRTAAAIAPSNPDVYYLIRTNGNLLGLEISLDKGATWDVIVPGGSLCLDPFTQNDCTGGQGLYDLAIGVDPGDWGHILVGGVQLYEWQHNPGSNPIGGGWSKAANLFESIANPYYVHADKHTIVWPTSNTVYIGGDGGIAKSIDNGETWQSKNYGYNVTTFYDATMSADGAIVGGAQDNGTQLLAPNIFGSSTPLGTVEIQGGDGFDVAFSRLGTGIVYATSQNGSLNRATPGGNMGPFYDNFLAGKVAPGGQPFHTVIENWENPNDTNSIDSVLIIIDSVNVFINTFNDTIYSGDTIVQGTVLNYVSLSNGKELQYTVPADIILNYPSDTIKLIDPVQNRFVSRFNEGCYLTRDAGRLNASNGGTGVDRIKWFKVAPYSNIENFEFSADGNHLFLGSSNGKVYRVSGLSTVTNEMSQSEWDAKLTVSQIGGGLGNGGVVSVAIDPNNPDNIIATASGYNTNPHVYRCTNAITANSTVGTFEAIQGTGGSALPFMPVYDCEIDYSDGDVVLLATDWGVWSCDNAFSSPSGAGVNWSDENAIGMAHVPVYAIQQQHLPSWQCTNSGNIYLGTHARGFYMSSDLAVVSVEENDDALANLDKNKFISDLSVYPNPVNTKGNIEFDLKENTNTNVKIYNITGILVKEIALGTKAKGNHKVNFDVSNLGAGSYILSLEAGSERKVSKFIVTK
ncbi:MAG: T9SS type A sorting domain-containing protein [Vicingaceae bacterium]